MIHYLENKVGSGPWALKLYQSLAFCEIYYSLFIFEVNQKFERKPLPWYFDVKIGRKNHCFVLFLTEEAPLVLVWLYDVSTSPDLYIEFSTEY